MEVKKYLKIWKSFTLTSQLLILQERLSSFKIFFDLHREINTYTDKDTF